MNVGSSCPGVGHWEVLSKCGIWKFKNKNKKLSYERGLTANFSLENILKRKFPTFLMSESKTQAMVTGSQFLVKH